MGKRRFHIDDLIINSPFEEPSRYWRYIREDRMFELIEGDRRPGAMGRALRLLLRAQARP